MTTTNTLRAVLPLFVSLGFIIACGSATPSQELVSARAAYESAETSPAKDLAPAKLLTAREALNRAEEAERSSKKERHYAYIAERLAKAAVAYAEIIQAERDKATANEEYRRLLEKRIAAAEKSSAAKAADLVKYRSELKQVKTDLQRTGSTLSKKEQELAEKAKALEAEKKARLAAEEKARAAIASLEEVAKVKEEKRGIVITLSGAVLFSSGKSALLPIAKQKLQQVAKALLDTDEDRQIVVYGHTDSRGNDRYNRRLSQDRAEVVRNYLVTQGVPATRIRAVGAGEDEPVASNKTAEGRANNRRVEIIVAPAPKG